MDGVSTRIQLVLAAVVMGMAQFAGPVAAGDWPMYRHDAHRTGAVAETMAYPLSQRWVYTAPAAPQLAWSSAEGRVIEGHKMQNRIKFDAAFDVAVVGNRLYFGSSVDHQLYCVDANTGEIQWTFFTAGPIRLSPTIANGRVYFGSDDGFAYCLNGDDGSLIWKRQASPSSEWLVARGEMISRWPVRTGVLVDNGVAFFGAGIFPNENVYVYAADAKDGTLLWRKDNISQGDAGRADLSPQGYLLATDELLVVPSGRALPAVFDRKTGKLQYQASVNWRGEGSGPLGGTRAFLADGQIYASGPNHIAALDQKTGKTGFGWFEARQMVVQGDDAYAATGSTIAKLDRQKYAEASRERNLLERESILLGQMLNRPPYQTDQNKKRMEYIRARLAELLPVGVVWHIQNSDDAALIIAGNHILSGGDGTVRAIRTNDGKEVWNTSVDGKAYGLAVANGSLYVSTDAGKIYCFAGGPEKPAQISPVAAAAASESVEPSKEWAAFYRSAAEEILKRSGINSGFCLVVGNEDGHLARELAKRTALKIYAIEPDADKVAVARKMLANEGLYGHRVTVVQADLSEIPFANYFANLVVSDSILHSGKLPVDPANIARHVKPFGGVVCFGAPATDGQPNVAASVLEESLAGMQFGPEAPIRTDGTWALLTRGGLPGAANWSHQYGDPGNTASSGDQRVAGGLSVLWYGDPGPDKVVSRHEGAVGPLAVNGKLFLQGQTSVMAYDAYNGQFLWEHENPGARRTGVVKNNSPGNLVASDDSIFIMIGDQCFERDAATGEVRAIHRLPTEKDNGEYEWGYVAFQDGLLYGTAILGKDLDARLKRRGEATANAKDSVFAIDAKSGKHLWNHDGKSISHHTIAIGPDRVCFIDSSITSEERAELLRQDKSHLESLSGEEANIAEERMKNIDARKAVALDAKTGKELWSALVDVTDCSEVGSGGGKLTMMFHNNTLLLCGANANGHFWRQFVAGEFKRRRLVALSADDGYKLWAKDANYRHRPIIVGNRVIAEPWAFELDTGEQIMHSNPVTGESVPWSIMRTGHHCGMLTGCDNMLMFRSGYTGFYDLKADAGVSHFAGHRLGCWINAIPANGLVMIPEASAGCVCQFSIASTIVLEPRESKTPWVIASSIGSATPVKHMALNLGAPGDRRDTAGTMWLAYPRPQAYQQTSLDVAVALDPKFAKGGGYESLNEETAGLSGTAEPWVLASWARGLTRVTVPLLGKDDAPATYTVKLYFAELDEHAKPGDRTFDINLNGETVLENYDPLASSGGSLREDVRVMENVQVNDHLVIELVPRHDNPSPSQLSVLNAIEIVREQ